MIHVLHSLGFALLAWLGTCAVLLFLIKHFSRSLAGRDPLEDGKIIGKFAFLVALIVFCLTL